MQQINIRSKYFELSNLSIENISPTLFSMGSGGLIGFLVGFAVKRVFKILAVIAGVFFGSLIYLQSQNLISVNWDRLQEMSQWTVTKLIFINRRGTDLDDKREFGHTSDRRLGAGFAFGVMKG